MIHENELSQITDKEYEVLKKVVIEHNRDGDKVDADQCLKDILLIDRSLLTMKSRSLLMRRSPSVKQQLDALIHAEITGKQPCWSARLRKYHFH